MSSQQRASLLSLDELNRIVLEFLHKKGYSRTEAMLRLESARNMTPQSGNQTGVNAGTMPLPPPPAGPETYAQSYLQLKEWVEASLDLYQVELGRVLYPVFVHMYLELVQENETEYADELMKKFGNDHRVMHGDEVDTLASLRLPDHIQENELAKRFRETKYQVVMSPTAFDLLLHFLHSIESGGGATLIRLVNQYINLQVTQNSMETGAEGLIGDLAFNRQPLRLGKMPLDPEFRTEVDQMMRHREGLPQTGAAPEGSLVHDFEKMVEPEEDSPAFEALPLPKYRPVDIDVEIAKVVDTRSRIPLGAALPSVCMYTFHNTYDEMNCLEFSDDMSLCAGGFGDSYIQLWSLRGEKLQTITKEDEATQSRRLIGHSGAVFGLSFAPDNRTLLSSSEDCTVRLWSLDTYTPLVAYHGHTGPVWDVTYGPFGHYFATASHDQTARLWSCDHIYPLRIFAGHLSDVECVIFHPNGIYLFTGSSDKTIRMWDVQRGQAVRVFIGHHGAVTCLAVSPDGRWLASAGEDSMIFVWDIGSGRRLKAMRGHGRLAIYSLAFSAGGEVLISSGADCSVRVWDMKKSTAEEIEGPEPYETSKPRGRKEVQATPDHMAVFFTKRTPVYKVATTPRNLVVAGGAFLG